MTKYVFVITPINENKTCRIAADNYETAKAEAIKKAQKYYPCGFQVELDQIEYDGRIGLCNKLIHKLLDILVFDDCFEIYRPDGCEIMDYNDLSKWLEDTQDNPNEAEYLKVANECISYFMEDFYGPLSRYTEYYPAQDEHLKPELPEFCKDNGFSIGQLIDNGIIDTWEVEKWKDNEAHNRNVVKINAALEDYCEMVGLDSQCDIPDEDYEHIVSDLELEPEGDSSF